MKFLKSHLSECIASIVIFGIFWGLLQNPFFVALTNKVNFTLFSWSSEIPRDDIVIVAFDDETLNSPEFKRFQDFSRSDYATLLEHILKDEPQTIGMDIFFFNPSEEASEDEHLAEILTHNAHIVIANEFDFEAQRFLYPSSTLEASRSQQGYVNLLMKSNSKDSVVTHVPLIIDKKNVQTAQYEPFGIRLWRQAHDFSGAQTVYDAEESVYGIAASDEQIIIPLAEDLININFFGEPGAYTRYSLYEVWSGNIPEGIFTDKIVLIGATARDLHDEFLTPRSSTHVMSGVEIHANFLQTLLDQKFITYQTEVQKTLVLAFSLALALIFFLGFQFRGASVAVGILLIGIYASAVGLFLTKGFFLNFATPILAIASLWGTNYTIRFLTSEKQKKQIKATFSKYVAKDIVNEILKDPEKIDMRGESHEVTIFFSDLAGFTTLSEKFEAREVMDLLNEYLGTMSAIILEEKGTIDKYIGDAVMAFWGAPLDCEDHAIRACRAALKQQHVLPEINKRLAAKGMEELKVRIGINTAIVSVGNIGTKDRLEYTVIGDGVNLASRLESINKQYGTGLIISEFTKESTGDTFFVRELDFIRVKGKTKPITIFELMALKGEETSEQEKIKAMYEKGLQLYRDQEWEKSLEKFLMLPNDMVSSIMRKRIKLLRQEDLPKDWDGVYSFLVK